ncbi:hypothetical protein Lal_00009001 [Lupinus albus]|nr:hypothetical protein Lal_00009001 [Lupinus albus]
MSFEGKIALVTGASRGIGRAIAETLVARGAKVIGTATSENGAQAISEYLGANGKGLVLNVTEPASIESVLENIRAEFGEVDILVNNAGITRDNLLMRMKDDEWNDIIETNLSSVFRLSKAVMRAMMKKRHGRIITVGSVVGTMGNAGQANYAAAKAGLIGFSKSLAREVASRGITVNVVAPGFIETDMTRALTDEQRAGTLAAVPAGRLGDPKEIASAVAFLASDEAGYITGETLHVNGGICKFFNILYTTKTIAKASFDRKFKSMSTIEERVKKIIGEQLGVKQEEVVNSASFVEDLGADSLDTVELVMALEEEFDTEIPDEEAEKITTVQAAIDYINGHQATNVSKRRVVVTGLGMLSPVGNTVESTWKALLAGQSGISLIDHFDTSAYATKFAGLVKDFNCEEIISRKEQRKMDAFIQYGIVAGVQAMQDSGLEITEENATRIGAAIGSGIGGLGLIEENHTSLMNGGPRKISPFFVPSTIVNMVAGHLTIMFGLRGPSISIATACTSGVHNIGQAARIIAYGDADAMVAGGAEKASTPLGVGGFGAARALSTRNDNPQAASRPWDKDRDGFVLGDGAGMLVLEEYEHAKKRGAKIYAEVVGFGMSSDAYHMTSPPENGAGAALAMENAIRDAGITPAQIGYVNAHGTSTPAGDKAEAQAVKSIFGESASRVLVSSTKSMTGHLLGAAGAVESIYSILALRDQAVPPTINLDNPDEGCDLDFVPHEARQVSGMEYTLCNSFGFGGTNGSLIFKKV